MTEPRSIHELIPIVSAEVGAVHKDGYNSGQKFNFRGIDAVVNACHSALARNGVAVLPKLHSVNYVDVKIGNQGKAGSSVRVVAGYMFIGPRGDHLEAVVAAEGNDMADKGTAKAMSVALRTALLQTLMLPTDDVDPDAAYDEQVPAHVALVEKAVGLLKSKGIGPDEAASQFEAIGGVGKISACTDLVVLANLIETLEGA